MMVKVGSDPVPCDLDRIQDLFPTDNLYLFDKDPLSPRSKALIRKRSTTASRLQRALSGKNKIVPTEKSGAVGDVIYSDTEVPKSPPCPRNYVMDTAVQLTSGVQSQERHLFLFSDVMVIAKIRASGNYKLKEKVRVAEMWLSNCVEVVCEVAKSSEASFVMGWPTTNVVATFSSTHNRDLWLAKLKQLIAEQQQSGSTASTSIRVHYWDPITKEECAQNVSVSQKDTVTTCIGSALRKLDINPNDADGYQLWVKVDHDSAPYPLIGHESPFAIKMNCLYVALAAAGDGTSGLSNRDNRSRTLGSSNCPVLKCYFILRSTKRGSFDLVTPKKGKRVRKSPILQKVFRRSLSKPESLDKTGDPDCLFGQSLTTLTRDRTLPKPIMDIMTALYEKGPYTMGIFRKSANARACRELREKLDVGMFTEVDGVDRNCLGEASILVLAALLKEFLRCLPDCLLSCVLYDEWMAMPRLPSDALKVQEARRLLSQLAPAHILFLQYFLCVLWHVQRRSSENMMTANNLAVCVGPSLLWSKSDSQSPSLAAQSEASKLIPAVVEFLILRCNAVLDVDCQSVFGMTSKVSVRDLSRQDSGNEESDSLHSSGGLRRDDSSIDSLEHALLSGDGETSPKLPCKAKMSLTNLSRDSGLTMSDTQLYTPDEEAYSETSSGRGGGMDRKLTMSSTTSLKYCEETDWKGGDGRMQSTPLKPSSQSSGGSSSSSGYRSNYEQTNHYCCTKTVKLPVTQTQSLVVTPSSSSAINKVEPIYGTQADSRTFQFPLGDRKDVIKRRLSRPRTWSRPVSAYGSEASPQTVHQQLLRKSASEESLLSNYELSPGIYSTLKRPVQHGKGKAPTPPPVTGPTMSRARPSCVYEKTNSSCHYGTMVRSKSVHHFCKEDMTDADDISRCFAASRIRQTSTTNTLGRQAALQWHHSRSTPHIESSYDSSTISDNDSTPHISRSNSRGKDYPCCADGVTGSAMAACGHGNYGVYPEVGLYGDVEHRSSVVKDSNNNVDANVQLGTVQTPAMKKAFSVSSPPQPQPPVHGEIHRAAPARVENSDEELEPAPPLPPKPARARKNQLWMEPEQRSTSDHLADEADWYENGVFGICHRPNLIAQPTLPSKTTMICGKRVLTATQSDYVDVSQWRTAKIVFVDKTNSRTEITPDATTRNCSRGRSTATSSRQPLKGSHLRAKSQPPPENRRHDNNNSSSEMDVIYDCPLSTAQGHTETGHAASDPIKKKTMTAAERLKRGATVGRTFRKELSWSVSQLRSLFSRNSKESSSGTPAIDGTAGVDVSASHRMWAASNDSDGKMTSATPPSQPPPPYRAPPKVPERNAKYEAKVASTSRTWTARNFIKEPSKSLDSQDSASGGEESYV